MITDKEFKQAQKRMSKEREHGYAIKARYDRRTKRIVVRLDSGLDLGFPPEKAEGLRDATPESLSEIQITPSGLGLHWPKLDADLYLPALMEGVFGSRTWMASRMGAAGGKARSNAKASSARENGRKGGRPRKAHIA